MKGDSQVYAAIVNVGDSSDEGSLFSGPLTDVISKLIQHIGSTTIAKRFDIAIAREQDIVVNRLLSGRGAKNRNLEQINDEIADLLARGPVESDKIEDNWTPPIINKS